MAAPNAGPPDGDPLFLQPASHLCDGVFPGAIRSSVSSVLDGPLHDSVRNLQIVPVLHHHVAIAANPKLRKVTQSHFSACRIGAAIATRRMFGCEFGGTIPGRTSLYPPDIEAAC